MDGLDIYSGKVVNGICLMVFFN